MTNYIEETWIASSALISKSKQSVAIKALNSTFEFEENDDLSGDFKKV